ncbi:NADPH-dependent aldehyde reductase [Fusarium beomiforme]|uniref:NADPH-dependent aldehyde reductase n=1 Tax=Fusarium beomiforme TaxID=44412 RepID=A0A9P5AJG4_9HYPO|nr:NADPH-dependent aldehyde reductase [Fusarium beomiforme]
MSNLPTAIPRGSWVLVTGANCYTGSHVVIELLKQGFKVRGTVRDLSYSKWLLEHPSVKPHADEGKVELVLANTSKPGDFDEAVRGVSAVIHLANIADYTPDPNVGFASALEAALTVCRSAAKEPSIKRFVLAAGLWTIVWPKPGETKSITQDTWNDDLVKAAQAPPPYELSRILPVYLGARVEAEKAVWKFVKDEKLPWELNSVSPCWLLGDPLDARHFGPMPTQLLQQLYLGKTDALTENTTVYYTHVSDAAVIYVAAAIDPDVKGARIPALAKSFNWNNALAIMRKAYPEEDFEDDFIPGDPVLSYKIEDNIAPELLQKWAGRDWISLEKGITETIDFSRKIGNLD